MSSSRKIIIKNNATFTAYVRVYNVLEHENMINVKGLRDTFDPISEVIEIREGETVQVAIDKGNDKTRIYYSNAKNQKQAKSIFGYSGPTLELLKDHFIEYKESPPDTEKPTVVKIPSFAKIEISTHKLMSLGADHSKHIQALSSSDEIEEKVKARVKKKIEKYKTEPKPEVAVKNESSGDIELSSSEKEFIKERDTSTKAPLRYLAQKAFVGVLPGDVSLPRIGLCGSGGGFRAMLAFHGFQTALHEQGLFDMVHYVSGTSGSTWAMADILAFRRAQQELSGYLLSYPKRITESMFNGIYSKIEFSKVKGIYTKALKERLLSSDQTDPTVSDFVDEILLMWTARLSYAALSGVDLEYQSDKGPREDIRKRSLSKFIKWCGSRISE